MTEQPMLAGRDWTAQLGDDTERVRMALLAMDDRRFMERLWAREPDLWKPPGTDQSEIADRLGWLTIASAMRTQLAELRSFAAEARASGLNQALLLGMGGSSLAPEVMRMVHGLAPHGLDLRILDSTNPAAVQATLAAIDPRQTLFIVSSKSGGTVEVMSFYRTCRALVEAAVGEAAGRHFVAITDPGTSLERLAGEAGFRRTFINPPDIGGRYSALSFFGLAPAALLGLDIDLMIERTLAMQAACGPDGPAADNPGAALGAIMGELAKIGRDKLTLVPSPGLAALGAWIEQLIAESTGKEGTGILPVDGETLGAPSAYGRDRLFVQIRLDGDDSQDAALAALVASGQPVVTIGVPDVGALGAEFYRWEMATAVAGALLGINAFDQPNVQESKDFTSRFLAEYQATGALPTTPSVAPGPLLPAALAGLLGRVQPGDYVALNAYLPPTEAHLAILQTMRQWLRDKLRVATTVGIGPRFLHSTGQFHKGGPNTGVFVQFTADNAIDVPIPGQAYQFGTLVAAQALGDMEALVSRGRRALRIHLPSDTLAGLTAVNEALTATD